MLMLFTKPTEFLRDNGICVFHLHDNLHNHACDFISAGMALKLCWEGYRTDDSYKSLRIPDIKLKHIIKDLKTCLNPAAVKYIGDENVSTSWVVHGYGVRC